MKRIFTHLFVLFLLSLVSTSAWAQLTEFEDGAVYRFVNRSTGRALNAGETNAGVLYVNAKTVESSDLKQQWYVTKEGNYYVLRNLYYAKYLKGAITNKVPWSLTDYESESSNHFSLVASDVNYNTLETKDWTNYGHMHDDGNGYNGGYRVVSWDNSSSSSHWTISKVAYTQDELNEILEEHPTAKEVLNKRTANFVSLFNEGACYTPRYNTLNAAKATAEYNALDNDLQVLVDNIYNKTYGGNWDEDNADDEKSGWSGKYAKKFRVQMYEPYSIAGDITAWLGINAHANNDNPTGIYMPAAGTLYVMVEGEVKEGATLRLINGGPNWRITNAASGGHELTTGLNIINFTEATGMLYICYNVDTYNPNGESTDKKFPHKLSDFAPLKIHIEGGAINGFYNACGDFRATSDVDNLWKTFTGASVDCDADWTYMETRANLSVVPVLGHRQILLFQLNDEDTEGNKGMKTMLPDLVNIPATPYNRTGKWADLGLGIPNNDYEDYKVNIMMEAWDRIMYSELATFGVVSKSAMDKMNDLYPRWKSDGTYAEIYDYNNKSSIDGKTYQEFCQGVDYSEYFNHHGVALGVGGDSYMYGGWDHCGYHHNTMGGVIGTLASSHGSTWGPAHEIGHQHQGIFNLNGQTEVTNNMFANIAVWYMGMGTSRVNGSEGSLNSVLGAFNTENNDAYTNNIWALTHMYYRLWLYYHLAGNNTQFMPRLFELLRNERLQNGGQISGDRSLLLFYKHACDAAGEDLTEFFRAHGYLEVMDNRLVGDYSNATYNQTQEMVDEAIAYVKGKWSKQNLAIILINDATSETTLMHDGTTKRSLWDSNATAEFGSVNDFIDGDVEELTNYAATVNADGSVTMSGGQGGVGFLIFNEKGELVSFSNKSTFKLGDEALETIVSGKATIVAVDTENKVVEAEVDITAMQKGVLEQLIAKAQSIVDKVDDTYTKIGYFKKAAVAGLESSLAYAKEVYAGSSGYEAAYDLLYAEYTKVLAIPDLKIALDLNKKYIISNNAYTTRNIVVDGATVRALENNTTAAQWSFVETGTAGSYYLKNAEGYYCPAVVTGDIGGNATKEQASAGVYTLKELKHGLWAIVGKNAPMHASASQSYNIVGWSYDATASQWYITATETDENVANLAELQVLVAKTETLLNEVAGAVTYTKGTPLSLQTGTQGSAYYLWSNAPETREGDIANLVDGGVNNHFHTDYSSEPPSGSHYLAVYLGEENTLERFTFSHTTRAGVQNDFPKSVDVYGSDDNVTYKYIGSASGMPQSAGTAWEFNGVMLSSYKYLRFNYHAPRGYWHMAEFDITPITGFTATVNDTYNSTVTVEAVTAAMNALHNGKRTANGISPTTGDVETKLQALQTAYNALYTQYEATINARKATLAQLVAETETLINSAGNVAFAKETPISLNASNFYCNAPYIASQNADYSAEYVSKLTDNNSGTYLHTRWNTNSDDGDYHYLRVDAGETTPIDLFYFTYTTASRGKKDMPLTMVVEGANEIDADNSTKDTFTEIATLTPLPEVLNTNTVYESSVLGSAGTKYRYLRFKVTDITAEEDDKNGHPFFTMSEFGLTSVTEENVTVNNAYKSCVTDELLLTTVHTTNSSKSMSTNALVTSVPLLDAQIADQTAAKTALEDAIASVTVDKTALQSLYDNALVLYGEMADTEGHVNSYYEPSALTNEKLAEAKTALDAAKTVLDSSNLQSEIDDAKDALQAQYDALLEIKNSDVTGRDELNALIGDMQSLLGEVADKTTAKTALALQTTDEDDRFYIWSNATAWDCNGIGALIDKNNDGTAKTGTFFGTTWDGGAVNSYDHYIAVDLGVDVAISELSIDYTTRDSNHSNQRPTAIKVLGSNDKEGEYAEITTLSEGMPVGQNQKWEMTSAVALNSYYRYIRFAPATEKGYFNMSDFNLYAHSAVKANDNYSTSDITGAQLFAMNAALLAGIDARDKFVTEENYNAALTVLQEQYNELLAIKNANVTERSSLTELIETTNTLVAEVTAINEEETAIALQATDANAPYYLYCNADGTETNGSGDKTGVAALVGDNKDNTTHLHTTYGNNPQDDDLDHYLRLDMGENEAMLAFKFSYTGRSSNSNNDPSVIVIQGCNTIDGEWEEIKTLTELPTEGDNVQYTSDLIESDKAFRYIRFMVTATQNNATNNGHPFFVLSKFSVTACKTIEVNAEYVSPNLPLSTLVSANNEVVDANAVVGCVTYVTQDTYNTALDELQAAKDALAAAIALKNIPVILTTDANNPVLYKIIINRDNDGNKRLKYDEASTMVAVDDAGMDRNQAWYFMSGDDPTKDILILPYMGEGKVLATNSFSEGNSKVKAVEKGADGYSYNWNIATIENSEWLNITIPNGSSATFYFSNHGGVSQKMGFYNHSDDGGSQFKFVLDDTDYSLSDAYYALYNLCQSCGGEKTKGDKIGQYVETTDYNDAYIVATKLLENKLATEDEYATAYETLSAAFEDLVLNLPVEGGLYIIKSANSNAYSAGKQIYVDAENKPYFDAPASENENLSTYIWQFEPVDGGYHLKSLHTQSYVSGAAWATQVTLSDDENNAKTVTIGVLDDATGQVSITVSGGYPLHAQDYRSKLVGYTGGANSASAWYIEAVGDLTTIKHTVTMNATFSSVMLGYNATVPAGVEAYNAEGIRDGYVSLVEVAREGGVIPANTPVILYRTDDNTSKTFTYTTTAADVPTETVLGGSLYQKFVKCDSDKDYYKLMIKGGEAKMYWMYKEFNAEGVSKGDSNEGGHIKCSANKIYMALPSQQQAASYGMRFVTPGATDIDEVNGEDGMVKTIYDLQGRKLDEITEPGFYIVNGKKILVK